MGLHPLGIPRQSIGDKEMSDLREEIKKLQKENNRRMDAQATINTEVDKQINEISTTTASVNQEVNILRERLRF